MLNQTVFDAPMPIRLPLSARGAPCLRERPNKRMEGFDLIPTRAPKKLQNYAKILAKTNGVALRTLYQEGAEQFMEATPWKYGFAWLPTRGLSVKIDGKDRNTGWMQVNLMLSGDVIERFNDLAAEQSISLSCISFTMMCWWMVCPPEDERRCRAAFEQIHGVLSMEDVLAEPDASLNETGNGNKTSPESKQNDLQDFDGAKVALRIKEKRDAGCPDKEIGFFLQKTMNDTGVSVAEMARQTGWSNTWIKSALAKASPEALTVAERIGVDPDLIGAGESLRLISWLRDLEKQNILDVIAVEIATGHPYKRALLDDVEDRYEICRLFPPLFTRTDLSMEDLRWVKQLWQSDDVEKREMALAVIHGAPMPEDQLKTLVKDHKVTDALLNEVDGELSGKDNKIAEMEALLSAQENTIIALQSQLAARVPERSEGAFALFSDGLKTFFETCLSKQGNLTLMLDYLKAFYADRVVVLDSACRSAEESDAAGFEDTGKAGELLFRLAGYYVDCMRENPRASTGLEVFGNKRYAPSEGATKGSSNDNKMRKARTSDGRTMMEHLKINGGFSKAKTLRIHFQYDASVGKVFIGHCGPHL